MGLDLAVGRGIFQDFETVNMIRDGNVRTQTMPTKFGGFDGLGV